MNNNEHDKLINRLENTLSKSLFSKTVTVNSEDVLSLIEECSKHRKIVVAAREFVDRYNSSD